MWFQGGLANPKRIAPGSVMWMCCFIHGILLACFQHYINLTLLLPILKLMCAELAWVSDKRIPGDVGCGVLHEVNCIVARGVGKHVGDGNCAGG